MYSKIYIYIYIYIFIYIYIIYYIYIFTYIKNIVIVNIKIFFEKFKLLKFNKMK